MEIKKANLKWKNKLKYGNQPQKIVLHHAEASVCSIEQIHAWHLDRGWSGCGYHYFVRKDGSIWQGRPETAFGAHCLHNNTNTIGVSAEGSYMKEKMPDVQKQAIVELGKYLCEKYKIKEVYGHGELNPSNCPGKKYPLTEVKSAILEKKTYSKPVTKEKTWLEVGDRGNEVKQLQANLSALGYKLNADGIYGKKTKNEVYNFQQDVKINADGLAGAKTISIIGDILKKPTCHITKYNKNATRFIQHVVGANVDGFFGRNTQELVKKWQKENGLRADGIVGRNSWKKLIK